MKPFDLEKAKAGDPVCFGDGTPVRLICFDRKSLDDDRSVVGLYWASGRGNREVLISFDQNGGPCGNGEHCHRLYMAPRETGGWINVYPNRRVCVDVFGTKAQANAAAGPGRVDCIHIKWKE